MDSQVMSVPIAMQPGARGFALVWTLLARSVGLAAGVALALLAAAALFSMP